MYQRALHNILLLRTVAPPAEQVTGLPTQQSAIPPTPSPADPAPSPNQTSPVAQPPEPPRPARLDRPSSLVCQPVSGRPEQVQPRGQTTPSQGAVFAPRERCCLSPVPSTAAPTPASIQLRTPGIPNEPSPIPGHSPEGRKVTDSALPRPAAGTRAALHSPCHPYASAHPIPCHATTPRSPKPCRLNRAGRFGPPTSQSSSFTTLRHRKRQKRSSRRSPALYVAHPLGIDTAFRR
jgi:hypothetical protein